MAFSLPVPVGVPLRPAAAALSSAPSSMSSIASQLFGNPFRSPLSPPMNANAFSSVSSVFNTSGIAFQASTFQSHLTTSLIGRSFLYFAVVDSTMNVSKTLSSLAAPSGSLIVAERQTQGRGRGEGRVWASQPKGNLYFTLLLEPLSPATLPVINFALPLAIIAACRAFGIENAKVKWPNDVWIEGKKLAGMLVDIEQHTGNQSMFVHAGVGININEDMTNAADEEVRAVATSVREHAGGPIDREKFLAIFCNELETRLMKYKTVREMMGEYESADLLANQSIIVMPKKREDTSSHYEALCLGYTNDGFMKIKITETGEEKLLLSEEVSVRTALSYFEEKERKKKQKEAQEGNTNNK